MKKTKLSLALSGLLIASAIFVVSCKKKDTTTTTTPDTSTVSATDNNTAQQSSNDIQNFGSESMEKGTISTYKLANGGLFSPMSGSVTITPDTINKTITITFNQFIGYDLHTRNGTIVYDWHQSTNNAKWYRDSGLVLNITTPNHDYTVDGNNVLINSKVIKNIGRISGSLTWTDNTNITITKANNAGTILWQGNWSIALLNTSAYTYPATGASYPAVFHGYGGPATNFIDWTQAIISITGSFNGTASDGETYTGSIGTPLVLNFNCTPAYTKYLYVAGTLSFTPTGKLTRTINYGAGVCDLTYVVSIGSFSVTITL